MLSVAYLICYFREFLLFLVYLARVSSVRNDKQIESPSITDEWLCQNKQHIANQTFARAACIIPTELSLPLPYHFFINIAFLKGAGLILLQN